MAPGDSVPEKTAPGQLELVQRFLNSVDVESGEEELTGPRELRAWLAARELIGPREAVGAADLRRAINVREGLRALLMANSGLEADPQLVERLDDEAARVGLRVRFALGADPILTPEARGVDGALGRLLAIVAGSVENGDWERMKACPRCEWAFFDRSKNRSGRWCRMDTCGNLEKARAFRERRRAIRSRGP